MYVLNPSVVSAILLKGGPNLVEVYVDSPELHLVVTGPGMLFDRLDLVTTLSSIDGCTSQAIVELADSIEGDVYCGLNGIEALEIGVESHRAGVVLQIGLGTPSMYQSELVLRTRSGETFQALIDRTVASGATDSFFVGLHAVVATTHMEHQHGGHEAHDVASDQTEEAGEHHGHA